MFENKEDIIRFYAIILESVHWARCELVIKEMKNELDILRQRTTI